MEHLPAAPDTKLECIANLIAQGTDCIHQTVDASQPSDHGDFSTLRKSLTDIARRREAALATALSENVSLGRAPIALHSGAPHEKPTHPSQATIDVSEESSECESLPEPVRGHNSKTPASPTSQRYFVPTSIESNAKGSNGFSGDQRGVAEVVELGSTAKQDPISIRPVSDSRGIDLLERALAQTRGERDSLARMLVQMQKSIENLSAENLALLEFAQAEQLAASGDSRESIVQLLEVTRQNYEDSRELLRSRTQEANRTILDLAQQVHVLRAELSEARKQLKMCAARPSAQRRQYGGVA